MTVADVIVIHFAFIAIRHNPYKSVFEELPRITGHKDIDIASLCLARRAAFHQRAAEVQFEKLIDGVTTSLSDSDRIESLPTLKPKSSQKQLRSKLARQRL